MVEARNPRASIWKFVLLLGLVPASACTVPRTVCVETYSPIFKLLVGLPFPTFITGGLAVGVMFAICDVLRRPRRVSWGGVFTIMLSCALLPILRALSWPEGFLVFWPGCMILLVFLSLRDHGHDPNQQSWMHSLSRELAPSSADRVVAGLLVSLLVIVTFIGSMITAAVVRETGLECHPVRPPAAAVPAGPTSSQSN